jgi:hypothetical protein
MMSELLTPRPAHTRSDAQHELLAGIIGVAIDTEASGLVGRCQISVPTMDGSPILASYLVPSNSNPNLWYAVARTERGLVCACPAFVYRGRCSHLDCCEEAPAELTGPARLFVPQPFRVGDPVIGTNPRNGHQEFGMVARVGEDRVTIATQNGAGLRTGYASYGIENVTPWQQPAKAA